VERQIDTNARRRLAELARHLAAGRITNFEFDDAVPRSSERAIHHIYNYGLWPFYDDLIRHRLIGKWALTPEGRSWVARIILFLRSNQPYRYYHPTLSGRLLMLPLTILTLGLSDHLWRRFQWRNAETSVWPFYTREEFEVALRTPVYLRGRADA
jgi:hypothetical protein